MLARQLLRRQPQLPSRAFGYQYKELKELQMEFSRKISLLRMHTIYKAFTYE